MAEESSAVRCSEPLPVGPAVQSGVCRSQSGVCRSQSAVCHSQSGVCHSQSAVCHSQSGVWRSQSGVCRSQSGVCRSQSAVCRSQSVVCRSQSVGSSGTCGGQRVQFVSGAAEGNNHCPATPTPPLIVYREGGNICVRCARRDATTAQRTRSLCGPSPVCNFGPKARIQNNSATVLTIQDPAHQKLTWFNKPLSVLIIKKVHDEDVCQPFCQVATWLIQKKQMSVYVEASVISEDALVDREDFLHIREKLSTFKEGDDLHDKIDFIICLGGDGTLLYASSLFQQSVPPVLAFHLGSLGFNTPLVFDRFVQDIENVTRGDAMLTLRSRLKCVMVKSTSPCARETTLKHLPDSDKCGQTIVVLNEVVVDRGPSSYLSNVDLFIDGRYVTSVQGDGVIISTPTGSTAYAAAAGASMLHPNVSAMLITPICPHSLSFRPIVVPAGVELRLSVSPESRHSVAWVSFDGRRRQQLCEGDSVRITTSRHPLPSVCSEDTISDWFTSLSQCLHWNVRRRQKVFTGTGGNGANTGGNGTNTSGNGTNTSGNGTNTDGNGTNTSGNGTNTGGNGTNTGSNSTSHSLYSTINSLYPR